MPTITTADVADLHLAKLSREVRVAAQKKMKFRQFVRPDVDFGLHEGNQYKFTKLGNIQERARKVGETDDIPQGKPAITSTLMTCDEYSLEVPYTARAAQIAELSLESMIIRQLQNNAIETLDELAAEKFLDSDLVYTPYGTENSKLATLSTSGTAGTTATRPCRGWDIKNIVGRMRSNYNIPGFGGSNNYICIASEAFLRGIVDDAEWIEASKYAQPDKLLNGEVGMYQNTRFIHENNVLNDALAGGGGEAVFFGDDVVVEIEIWQLELQRAIADSYGRSKAIRWTWFGGFEKTWDYPTENETRSLLVSSL